MYAVQLNQPFTIDVFDTSVIDKREKSIAIPCGNEHDTNYTHTLVARQSYLAVCCTFTNLLYKVGVNTGDKDAQQFGKSVDDVMSQSSHGSFLGSQIPHDPGVLDKPRICGIDAQDNILIADSGNNRLQVLTSDEQWSVVDVDETLVCPESAVWFNQRLYVTVNRRELLVFHRKSRDVEQHSRQLSKRSAAHSYDAGPSNKRSAMSAH